MNVTYTGHASDKLHAFNTLTTRQYKHYKEAHEAAEKMLKRKYGESNRFQISVSVTEV